MSAGSAGGIMTLDELRPAEPQAPPVAVLARLPRRSAAALVDALILIALLFAESYVLVALVGMRVAPDLGAGDAPYFIVAAIVAWLYCAGFESGRRGATPGKRLLSLKVIDTAGEPVTFAQATLRYAARYLTLSTLMLGWFLIPLTKRRQSLHDLAAGTVVVNLRMIQ